MNFGNGSLPSTASASSTLVTYSINGSKDISYNGNVYKNCFTALLNVLIKDFGEKTFTSAEDTVLTSTHHQSFFNKQTAVANNNIQNLEAQEYVALQKLD